MHHSFILKQIILILFLFSVSKTGDALAQYDYVKQHLILRCLVDNIAHVLIGVGSWFVVVSYDKLTSSHVFQSLLCGLFSGIIDVDHFIMARSIHLKDAVSLSSRPPFHNTTLMISIITCFIILMHRIGQDSSERIGWFLLIAIVSHHLRDAMRHGLWLWPQVTRPLSFYDCLIMSYLFSLAVGSLLKIIHHPSPAKEKNVLEV